MINRSDIFRRAHQLKKWNKGFKGLTGRAAMSYWLRAAWAEAKAGTLPSFAPVAVKAREIAAVELAIKVELNTDRGFSMARVNALTAQLSSLQAAA